GGAGWRLGTAFARPVSASHSRDVPSQLPVRTVLPSGLNATLTTRNLCPLRVAFSIPVVASHSRIVPSRPPVRTRLPSGLNATLTTQSAPLRTVASCPGLATRSRPVLSPLPGGAP